MPALPGVVGLMVYEPCLFELEDRGYNQGCGHLVMPDGSHVAVAHNDDEMGSALVAAWWGEWRAEV